MSIKFERLKAHIISLSQADDFYQAKTEWKLTGFYYDDEWDECPCGQEIKELCYIQNQLNSKTTYVGNVCINQFIGIDTGNLFDGLKRIIKDSKANPNADLIKHAFDLGYIFKNELPFLMQMKNKRNRSQRQLAWIEKINKRIINKTKVRRTL